MGNAMLLCPVLWGQRPHVNRNRLEACPFFFICLKVFNFAAIVITIIGTHLYFDGYFAILRPYQFPGDGR